MPLSAVASVVGIAAGANALFGGGGGGGGGGSSGGGGGGTAQTYDPYGPYRTQSADKLNTLMNDPSQAIGQPGYAQQLQAGMQQTNRGMAATGQSQSGAEQLALNSQGQNTFGSYYNSQVANLMQLSGASQSPAAAGQAQTQANLARSNIQTQGLSNMASGAGGLNAFFGSGGGNQSSAQNAAGYASTGASYQQSFGSDMQFGDGSYYGGPV